MSWSLVASGHFPDEETFREMEVKLDELVRDFFDTVRTELGEQNIATFSLSGQYIGTIHYTGPDASTVRPELPPNSSDEALEGGFTDESVVGEGEDDGLGGDDPDSERDPDADPDAAGYHPGDVTDPANEELAVNRTVPSVELSPNPEDQTGYDRTEATDDASDLDDATDTDGDGEDDTEEEEE